MKFMPPKLNYYTGISSTNHGGLVLSSIFPSEAQRLFDAWYAREITPLFENAIEVTGFNPDHSGEYFYGSDPRSDDTHSALLIKIEPLTVKEESAEDLLRELIGEIRDDPSRVAGFKDDHQARRIYQKAKAYLEKHKETK